MGPEDKGQFITVKEFLEGLDGRLGRNTVYQAIVSGEIPSVRVGKRILLPKNVLQLMLEKSDLNNHDV